MTFLIEMLVIVAWFNSIFARRDDRFSLFISDDRQERISIIGFVGNGIVKLKGSEQGFRLGNIMSFTASEDEA
jgi:hypothetical protein